MNIKFELHLRVKLSTTKVTKVFNTLVLFKVNSSCIEVHLSFLKISDFYSLS